MKNSVTSISDIKPVEKSERLHSLDILRGVAILSILVINIKFFAQPLENALQRFY